MLAMRAAAMLRSSRSPPILACFFSAGQPSSVEAAATIKPQDPSAEKKPPTFYSTTPLMMDANSTEPLKSSEFASSHDDQFGVQKNWFTSLYKQLNYFAKTGAVPNLNGRQRQVCHASMCPCMARQYLAALRAAKSKARILLHPE